MGLCQFLTTFATTLPKLVGNAGTASKESNCPLEVRLTQVGSYITAFQAGWCTGPALTLGLGEALSQQSQGLLVEGIPTTS